MIYTQEDGEDIDARMRKGSRKSEERDRSESENGWSSVEEEVETKGVAIEKMGEEEIGRKDEEKRSRKREERSRASREKRRITRRADSEGSEDRDDAAQLRPLLTPSS